MSDSLNCRVCGARGDATCVCPARRMVPMTNLLRRRTILVRLSDDLHDELDRRAAAVGKDADALIEEYLLAVLADKTPQT